MKLFKKKEEAVVEEPQECQHAMLIPRWDNAEDMGKKERVSFFTCEACNDKFDREAGEGLRERQTAKPMFSS